MIEVNETTQNMVIIRADVPPAPPDTEAGEVERVMLEFSPSCAERMGVLLIQFAASCREWMAQNIGG